LIERRWGTSINPPKLDPDDNKHNEYEEYEDDDEVARTIPEIEDSVDANGQLLNQLPAYNKIIHSEVALQLGESIFTGKVTKRALGPDGRTAGTYDDNPMLNSIVYAKSSSLMVR
jgi:hypothetical protein